MAEAVRLDKWLWAARFFKTRALARQAVESGHVRVDGDRAKPGKTVLPGLRLEVRMGQDLHRITVTALSDKRGPATVARGLYEESAEERERREREAAERKVAARGEPDFGGRPDKYQRRQRERLLRDHPPGL
jgi:ribosome-associated heat shock protein Hsp15